MFGLKFFVLLAVVFGETCKDQKSEGEEDVSSQYEIPPDYCIPPERLGFIGTGKLTYLEDCPDLETLYPSLPMPASPYTKVPADVESKNFLWGV